MVRIGIVGCGRILAAHLRGYQLLREAGVGDFEITALCSRREESAQMYAVRGKGPTQRPPVGTNPGDPLAASDIYLSDFQPEVPVKIYTDFRQMMGEADIDGINDLTTHALHHQVGQAALESGKHLLTEKPLAISVAAARSLCELAERKGVAFAVLENARNRADTRQLEWLFRDGRFGNLQLLMMANVGNWWAPDRIVAETPWRHRYAEGGGITLDIGVHLFNHIRYVAGEVTSVQAQAETIEKIRYTRDSNGQVVEQLDCDADDFVVGSFQTERGVTGTLTASWAGHGAPTQFGGTRGLVYYGSQCQVVDDRVTLDDGSTHSLAELYRANCPAEETAQHFPHGLQDAFALNQLDWLQAIHQGREPETSGREGLHDLAASYAALESSLAGRRVTVEEVLSGELRDYQRAIDEHFGIS